MLKTKNCSRESVYGAGEAEDVHKAETHAVKFASSEKPWHRIQNSFCSLMYVMASYHFNEIPLFHSVLLRILTSTYGLGSI